MDEQIKKAAMDALHYGAHRAMQQGCMIYVIAMFGVITLGTYGLKWISS